MQTIKWVVMGVLVMGSAAHAMDGEPLSPKEAKRHAKQIAAGKVKLDEVSEQVRQAVKVATTFMNAKRFNKTSKAAKKQANAHKVKRIE